MRFCPARALPGKRAPLSCGDVGDLASLGEFGLIRRLLEHLPATEGLGGPGDDAAVLPAMRESMVVTADILVQDRHFDLGFSSPPDVGFKALTVNVSDVAAMGATPRYAVVSLGAPAGTDVAVLEGIYEGIAESADEHGVAIVGGDTTGSPVLLLSIALIGEATEGRALPRSGALEGDFICVTGALGAAVAGLQLHRRNDQPARAVLERFPGLATAHRRGRARVAEGRAAARGGAHAMIDVSDGLVADLGHICETSGLGAVLDTGKIPIDRGVEEAAAVIGVSPLDLALHGGDDYELVIAVPRELVDALGKDISQTPLSVIGRFVAGSGVSLETGETVQPRGWDHFKA
jgi:thiamine-monophosphate kinase